MVCSMKLHFTPEGKVNVLMQSTCRFWRSANSVCLCAGGFPISSSEPNK